jgi:hypothetical protein
MARRYARDNRGRFSSTGATARGGRLATASGNKRATVTARISGGKSGGKPAGAIKGKVKRDPGAAGKIGASKPKATAKPAPKVDTSLKGVAARRARALAPRTSTYLSQKLNTQSAITRSAANAIYNRQRAVGKQLGLDQSVVRNPIGIMPKASGSIRNMAMQVREAARKRVVGGRRR